MARSVFCKLQILSKVVLHTRARMKDWYIPSQVNKQNQVRKRHFWIRPGSSSIWCAYLTWINFRVDKFSRMPTSKNFTWINFREWPGLKNFAWIYFREDREFDKYFSPKKRKTTLLSIKSFYKSSKNYKYVNKFYMFDGV